MRATALAVTVGFAVLVVAVAQAGNAERRHVVRANLVPPVSFVVTIPGNGTACQAGEVVPEDAGVVRLRLGTFGRPGPPLAVTLRAGGERPITAQVGAGWREGDVDVELPGPGPQAADATVCVRNGGERRVVVAGAVQRPASAAAKVRGAPTPGRMAVAYLESEPRSWWSFTAELGSRIAAAREALPGGATFVVLLVGTLVTCAGAFVLVVCAGRRP